MSAKTEIALTAVKAAHVLIDLKMRTLASQLRRDVSKEIHVKQFEQTERAIQQALIPFFRRQIASVKKNLAELGSRRSADTAQAILSQVYDPAQWKEELIDRIFPVLARAMGEAGKAQLEALGISTDKTTASEWLEFSGDELPPGLSTELPLWMIDAIEAQLQTTFEQPYWDQILTNTGDQINEFLRNGLTEGWSISQMASEINRAFPTAYSRRRAEMVARTEAANALNGARRLSMDNLQQELADVPLDIVWISVLGNTTRETHAALHDVPADENGMFNLAGNEVPWPGHWSLPPEERINCFPAGISVQGRFCGAQRAWYEGTFSEIVFRSGRRITMTPNHPVVTSKGLVAAGVLNPGDQVMTYGAKTVRPIFTSSGCYEIQHKPSSIEQVFEAFFSLGSTTGEIEIRRRQMNDFYGDGESIQGDIEVVRANWKLLNDGKFGQFEKRGDSIFSFEPKKLPMKASLCYSMASFDGRNTSTASLPSSSESFFDVFRRFKITPAGSLAIGIAADFDTGLNQSFAEDGSCVSGFLRESLQRHSRLISFDDVVEVRNFYSAGHVYDLQSDVGLIVAHDPRFPTTGIVTQNCQCTLVTELREE
jgi:hypothetical protein